MRVSHILLASAVTLLMLGCQEGTPGGPGAKTDDSTTTADPTVTSPEMTPVPSEGAPTTTDPAPGTTTTDDSENSFTLDAPNLTTNLKQGEQQIVSIGISRGSKFQQDVTLSFGNLPPGVTVEPAMPVIKVGENEAKVTLKASADAALEKHEIKIIGHPAVGKDATNSLHIDVSKP